MPYSAKTEIKKYAQRFGREIIGKGSMSIVTAAYLDDYVLKHTYCLASSKFLEMPWTVTKEPIYFVSADYRSSEYINTKEGELIVNTFQLPRLHKCRKQALPPSASYDKDSNSITLYRSLSAYRALARTHLLVTFNNEFFMDNWEVISEWVIIIHTVFSEMDMIVRHSGENKHRLREHTLLIHSVPELKALAVFLPALA